MPAFQTSSPSARPHKAYLPTYISQILISESPLSPLYKSFIVIHDGSDLHPLKKHAMFEMFMWLHIKSNTSDWKKNSAQRVLHLTEKLMLHDCTYSTGSASLFRDGSLLCPRWSLNFIPLSHSHLSKWHKAAIISSSIYWWFLPAKEC